MSAVRDAARAANAAGFSIMPVKADGTKAPDLITWTEYQTRRPTNAELKRWFPETSTGLGVIGGAISGGLEWLDIEGRAVTEGYVDRLNDLIEAAGLAPLFERITAGYFEATPSGGYHIPWHISDGPVPGSSKLAQRAATPEELAIDPDKKIMLLAETKGEGGYVVTAPSNGSTHPSGQPWQLLAGGFDTIATITREERDALIDLIRSLDEMPATPPKRPRTFSADNGDLPGAEINARLDPTDILIKHGWQFVSTLNDTDYLRRPGKAIGISATVRRRQGDHRTAMIFTTSTCLPSGPPATIDAFGLIAHLEHDGNFPAAARAWRALFPKKERGSHTASAGTQDRTPDEALTVSQVLPASFWSERSELAHIQTSAFSRMISPDAVLACVLARVVALTHHQFVLPDVVGRVGSVNLDVAIVAPSGGGKGSASDTSADLVTAPNILSTGLAGEFREISAGSGEGLVRAFFKRKRSIDPDTGKQTMATVQTCWNALVRIDEGEMLARLAKRQDQTTMTVIRQAWSGERLGASYADDDKNLHIDAHGYRLSIVMGVQPELGRFLLDDIASGTPQRFTFLSGRHPDIPNPDHLPAWPGPLRWTPVSRPPDAHGLHEIGVAATVAYQLRSAHHERVTGATDDAYGGHGGLRRLKVAAGLALLANRINVNDDDWRLAGIIEDTSTVVRATMAQAIANEDATKAHTSDKRAIGRELAVADALEHREAVAIERVAKVLVRRVRKLGGSATVRELQHAVASRDRTRLTPATDFATAAGWLTATEHGLELGAQHLEVSDEAA